MAPCTINQLCITQRFAIVVLLIMLVSNGKYRVLDVAHGFAIQPRTVQSNKNNHHYPPPTAVTRSRRMATTNIHTRVTCVLQAASDQEFETLSSLEVKLSALLQEAIGGHDDNDDMDCYDDDEDDESVIELEKLSLLYTRRENLILNRTYVDKSAIAGRGLFASCDAKKGDLLTCYPGDALVIVPDDDEDEFEDEYEDQPSRGARLKKEKQKRKQQNNKSQQVDDDWTIVWGEHVTMAQEQVEAELQANLRAFTLHAGVGDNNVGIFALPSMDDNPAYLGHFVNDGATKIPMSTKGLSSYMLESSDTANAVHQDILGGVHMVTLAKRDIKKGEEIFVTYGPEYWMEQPDFGNLQDEDMDAVDDINEMMSNGKGFGS